MDLERVGRYLAGEASPEDAMALDRWREADPRHERAFRDAALLWEAAGPAETYRPGSTEAAWERLAGKLPASAVPVPPLRSGKYRPWMAAAGAALLLGLSLAAYLFLSRGQPVFKGPAVTAADRILTDTLSDASVVTLAPGSSLRLSDKYASRNRAVEMQGEGYFSVSRQRDKPFVIYTGGIEIRVLGTDFNVADGPRTITVGVSAGAVRMQRGDLGIEVQGGSTGVFDKEEKRFRLYSDSLDRNASGYATRTLYFYDMPLEAVKGVLERAYQVRVLLQDTALAASRINTKFDKQPLPYVLEVISASLGVRYRIQGNTVYIFDDPDK